MVSGHSCLRKGSVNTVKPVIIEIYDVRRPHIGIVVPELNTRVQLYLKGLILHRLPGKIDRPQFNRIKDQVLITGPYARADTMIERGFIKCGMFRRKKGQIAKGKGSEFKTQQLVIHKKARLRVERDPLVAKS